MSDFLVTDRRALPGVTPVNDRRAPEEELLLAPTADGAGVALYIDPRVLSRLERADPMGSLTEDNIADFCTALEGVSHFVYSVWRLGERRAGLAARARDPGGGRQVCRHGVSRCRSAGRRLPGARSPSAVRPRGIRCPVGAGAIRALSDGASLRREFLPAPGEPLRRPPRNPNRGAGARVEKFYRLGNTAKLRYAML